MDFLIKTKLKFAKIIDGKFDIPLECKLQIGDKSYLIYANLGESNQWDLFKTLNSAFSLQPRLPEDTLLVNQAGFFQYRGNKDKLSMLFPNSPIPTTVKSQSIEKSESVCFWFSFTIHTSGLFSRIIDIGYDANGQDDSKLSLLGVLESGVENKKAIKQCLFKVALPNIRLVQLFNFENLNLQYQFGEQKKFYITGDLTVTLFEHDYSFHGLVDSDSTRFITSMSNVGNLSINSPFSSMPGIVFSDLVFNANYTYKQTSPENKAKGIFQVSVSTELANLSFHGQILLNDSTPVMASVELDKPLTISQLVDQCVNGHVWPDNIVDITFLPGSCLYYQKESATPNDIEFLSRKTGEIVPKAELSSLPYESGFNIYSKFILRLITDISLEGNVTISADSVSGEISKPGSIDLWVVSIIGAKQSDGTIDPGPVLMFNSKNKSMGFRCGLTFFQSSFGLNTSITVIKDQGKQVKINGKLQASSAIEPFFSTPPNLDFSYDKTNGFKINNWDQFVLESNYIKFAEEIEKIVSTPDSGCAQIADKLVNGLFLKSKFSITPSFSTSNDQLTLDLRGSYSLSCAGKEFLTLNFPAPLKLPLQTHWSFSDLHTQIGELIKNSAQAFIDALLANDEAIAKFIGIMAGKAAAKYAATLVCRGLIDSGAEAAATSIAGAAGEAAAGASGAAAAAAAVTGGLAAAGSLFCCFVKGTKVYLADGSQAFIENIRVGDQLLGNDNEINTVVRVYKPTLGKRKLYSINRSVAFVTKEHPFFTRDGLKSISPTATLSENPGLAIGQLKIGDRLLINYGDSIEVTHIDAIEADPQTPLFNFELSDSHSYIANEYFVHNKGGGDHGGKPKPGPAKPAGVSATYSAGENAITVKWNDPKDSSTSFFLWLQVPGVTQLIFQSVPDQQYTSDIPVKGTYSAGKYKVFVNAKKNGQSVSSGPVELIRLKKVSDLSVTKMISNTSLVNDQIKATWTGTKDENQYQVSMKSVESKQIIKNATTSSAEQVWSLDKSVPEGNFIISVNAFDASKASIINSVEVNSNSYFHLGTVNYIQGQRKGSHIQISWKAVDRVKKYQVAYSLPNKPSAELSDVGNVLEWSLPLPETGVNGEYKFTIRACSDETLVTNGAWGDTLKLSLALSATQLIADYKTLNYKSDKIAQLVMENLPSTTPLDLVQAMHDNEYGVEDTGQVLKSAFPNITATDIAKWLTDVYGKNDQSLSYILTQAYKEKKTATEAGQVVQGVYPSIDAIQLAVNFENVGYLYQDVGQALKNLYPKISASDLALALTSAYGKDDSTPESIAIDQFNQNKTAIEAAQAIHQKFNNITVDELAAALSKATFNYKQTASAIKDQFPTLEATKLASILLKFY